MSQLPVWADQVRRRYEGGVASVFCFCANTRDLQPLSGKYLPFSRFLVQAFTGGKSLVLSYSIRSGLTAGDAAMERDFVTFLQVYFSLAGLDELKVLLRDGNLHPLIQEKLKNPAFALPLLERMLESRSGVALIIDEIESIAPHNDLSHLSLDDRRNLSILRSWAENPRLRTQDSFVFWVSENLSEVNQRLRAGTPNLDIAEVPFPSYDDRLTFIRSELQGEAVKLELSDEQLSAVTAGLTLNYVQAFFTEARRSGGAITLDEVRQRKEEIFRDEYGGLLRVQEPTHGLDAVAGMEAAKKMLRVVVGILRGGNRQDAPMGIGLCGPPGTGKTYMAKALAKEAGLPFVEVGNVRGSYVGESERNADKVISLLRSMVPVIVFYDEIDQAYGQRGESGDSGVGQRLWAKFSTFMADSALRGLMLTFWATNRPDLLDEATKRPDRGGDLKIPVFFATEDPEAVLRISAQRRKFQLAEFDWTPILEKVPGYSPAELNAVLTQARWFALEEGKSVLEFAHVLRGAETFTPSRNDQMIEYMEVLAVLECTDQRLLSEKYQALTRADLLARSRELRFELQGQGLLR